jgi:hypothetical protein
VRLFDDEAVPGGLPDNRLQRPLAEAFGGLPAAWAGLAQDFLASAAGQRLCTLVDERRAAGVEVYPADPLRALRSLTPAQVKVVHARRPDWFGSVDRSRYVITNSWSKVEFPALTGRSVPTEAEVLAPDNLARLAAEIASLRLVVACGAQAQAAVRAVSAAGQLTAHTAFGRHLSQRSVNMIAGGSDTPSRIARWCDDLLDQLSAA